MCFFCIYAYEKDTIVSVFQRHIRSIFIHETFVDET